MAKKKVKVKSITAQEMRDLAIAGGVNVPIEQTWVWAEFEETFPHRKLIGFFKIEYEKKPVAILSLVSDKFRGFEFFWAKHGPVWLVEESESLEHEAVDALVKWARKKDSMVAFLRLHLRYPRKRDEVPLSTPAFDEGVILDVGAQEDAFRDSLREDEREKLDAALDEGAVKVKDITDRAVDHLGELYELVDDEEDVAARDFPTLSREDYRNLLATLGDEHARVYLATEEDEDGEEKPLAWAVFTIGGNEAVYYQSAIDDEGEEHAALSQILHRANRDLREAGVKKLDMVGMGPDLLPAADEDLVLEPEHLELEKKFAETTTHVRPAYDVPVNRVLFALVEQTVLPDKAMKKLKRKLKKREKDD